MKNNTINKKEIEKFSKIAEEWWNPTGKFKPLHKFNPIRISYIKNNIINSFKIKSKKKPLEKIRILDVGCGGGLLSEPMTRLGAEVVGLDASDKNINVAKLHAAKNKLRIKYFCTSPENYKASYKFEIKKIIKSMGEKCKVYKRNIRIEANDELKKLLKDKEISEDEVKKKEKIIQDYTDSQIKVIEDRVVTKENEIMTI